MQYTIEVPGPLVAEWTAAMQRRRDRAQAVDRPGIVTKIDPQTVRQTIVTILEGDIIRDLEEQARLDLNAAISAKHDTLALLLAAPDPTPPP